MEEAVSDKTLANRRPCIVSRMIVDGFWKDHRLDVSFDQGVNFLIGPNGTGKTTIVNLLAAAITADFRVLDRIDFKELRVELTPCTDHGESVVVQVVKERVDRLPLPQLTYRITDLATSMTSEFSLDDIEEQLAIRDQRIYGRRRFYGQNTVISKALGAFVDASWLSVHRHEVALGERQESIESLVDAKLEAQANHFVRYFSRLDQHASDVLKVFQQGTFLSLIADQEDGFDLWGQYDFDIQKERGDLIAILEQFKIQRSRYQSKVERHFVTLREALTKTSKQQGISNEEVVAIVNQRRIHGVVSDWNDSLMLQRDIYKTRDAFVSVINAMLIGKEIFITNANEIAVRTSGGRNIPVKSLSSGEKQLLIIMGQALLQDGRPAVFIADEPELSLHVAWQESLVDHIREINPACQIIFATHSPDVVGRYLDRVIESHEVFEA